DQATCPGQLDRPARTVGMGQAVEPVAAHAVALLPLAWHRVRRCRWRDGRVERGVETGHRRHLGQHAGHRVERGKRFGLVQWGQAGQLVKPGANALVDANRSGEVRPTVHDAMPNGGRRGPFPQGACHVTVCGQVGGRDDRVAPVKQAQLQAGCPGVDDKDVHARLGHAQLAIAGSSSPYSRVYARAASRASAICWRSVAARLPSEGTRSMTSMTRWKRSRSLSITMSNGVVVVPSSLYPRTWMLGWLRRRYVSRWISHG